MEEIKVGLYLTSKYKSIVPRRDLTKGINLLLYPESHDLWESKVKWKLHAEQTKTPIIVGLRDERGAELGYFYNPKSRYSYTYRKHSMAHHIAFQDNDWTPEDNLQIVHVNGFKVGITLCHDMYLPLLMRYLVKNKKADILVNPSGEDVNRKKWSIILRARAMENYCYTLCTMHHQPHHVKNKAHVFGFHPSGTDLLFKDSRTGREYTLYETIPDNLYLAQLSKPPKRLPKKRKSILEYLKINPSSSKPGGTIEVNVKGDRLQGKYKSHKFRQSFRDGPSQHKCGNKWIFILPVKGPFMYSPEKIFDLIYQNKDEAKSSNMILWNHWEAFEGEVDSKLVPVIAARTIEWRSPVIVTIEDKDFAEGFETTIYKDVRRVYRCRTKMYFWYRTAVGLRSAFRMVTHHKLKSWSNLMRLLKN